MQSDLSRANEHPATHINRQIIEDYKTAYVMVHGREPEIVRSGNWWRVEGHVAAFRMRDFGYWTQKLLKRAEAHVGDVK